MPILKKLFVQKLLASAKNLGWPKLKKIRQWPGKIKAWSGRKKLLVLGLSLLALIPILFIFGFFLTLLSTSREEVSLIRLDYSFRKETICHEDCASKRHALEKEVASALYVPPEATRSQKKLSQRLSRRLENLFLNRRTGLDFRMEIINLYADGVSATVAQSDFEAAGKRPAPRFLADYLSDPQGNPALQGRILLSFAPESLAAADPASLADGAGQTPLDYYFNILTGGSSWALKQEAVRALSSYPDKRLLTETQLTTLEELILSPASPAPLRQSLVMLLSDYYRLFPEPTGSLLERIYNPGSGLDSISRLFAADTLNHWRRDQLPLPTVSASEWDEYYNQ